MSKNKKPSASKNASGPVQKSRKNLVEKGSEDVWLPIETALNAKKYWLALIVFIVSALLQFTFYQQAKDSPAVSMHKWESSDMSFYDAAARHIAGGDWLCDTVLHPYHEWHDAFASTYFNAYPEVALPYYTKYVNAEGSIDSLGSRQAYIQNLFQGKVFHQEPLYVYLIAITYKIFGAEPKWVFIWQMLLGALMNVLVFLVGQRYFGSLAGLLGAILVMLSGPIMVFEMTLLRTTLTAFLSLLILYLYQRMLEQNSRTSQILFGAVSGLSILAQSYLILFFIPAIAWYAWTQRQQLKKGAIHIGFILGGFLLIMFPLMIRNSMVGVPMMSMASNGSITYILFNSSHALPLQPTYLDYESTARLMHDSGQSLVSSAIACLQSFDGMGSLLHMYKQKMDGLFIWFEIPNNMSYYMYKGFSSLLKVLPSIYGWLAPIGICGFFWGIWRYRLKFIPFALMVLVSASPMFIGASLARYRVPFAILMTLLAAFFLFDFLKTVIALKRKELLAQILLLSIAIMYTSGLWDKNFFPLFPYDVTPSYTYHYQERLIKLKQEGNNEAYLKLTTDLIGYLPDYFFTVQSSHHAQYAHEAECCRRVALLVKMHAGVLADVGRASESAVFVERAQVLNTIADDFAQRTGN